MAPLLISIALLASPSLPAAAPRSAAAQVSTDRATLDGPAGPAPTVPPDDVARARAALDDDAVTPGHLRIRPVFRTEVVAPFRTFADYVRGEDLFGPAPPSPPSDRPGPATAVGGIDVLSLVMGGVHRIREANRNRQARAIRAQIQAELAKLTATSPPD